MNTRVNVCKCRRRRRKTNGRVQTTTKIKKLLLIKYNKCQALKIVSPSNNQTNTTTTKYPKRKEAKLFNDRPSINRTDGRTYGHLHGPTKRMGQMYPLNSVHRNDQQQWQEATTLWWSLQQNNNSNKDSSLLPNGAEQSRRQIKPTRTEWTPYNKSCPKLSPHNVQIWRHLPNTTAHTHIHTQTLP